MSLRSVRPLLRALTGALAAIALAGSILGPAEPARAGTSVSGSFPSWQIFSSGGAQVTASIDRDVRRGGSVAAQVANVGPRSGGSFGGLTQTIAAQPSTEYSFSAWVRTHQVADAQTARFVVNAAWSPSTWIAEGSAGWTELTWSYRTKADESSLVVALVTESTGRIWIDDLSVRREDSSTNLLRNPGFETAHETIRVLTPDLVLPREAPDVVVDSSAARVAWELTDTTGAAVKEGIVVTAAAPAAISLLGVPDGFYSLELSAGTTVRRLDVGIVGARGPAAVRWGTTMHVDLHGALDQTPLLTDLGIASARVSLRWENLETEPGVFSWDPNIDAAVAQLRARGIQPVFVLAYANRHYDGGRTPSSAEGIAAFARFAAAAAARYGADAAYEIYNEWNAETTTSACGRTPECYLELLGPARAALREAAPGATVVGPVLGGLTAHWLTTDESYDWLQRFFELGGLDLIDVVSIHNYGFPSAPEGHNEEVLERVRALVDRFSPDERVELWLTETGWATVGTAAGGVDEAQQASYLARDAILSAVAGVDRYFVYDLLDDWADPTNAAARFGLFRNPAEQKGTLAPKPAGVAFATATRQLEGFTVLRSERPVEGTRSILLSGPDGASKRALWATGAARTVLIATSTPITVTDQWGTDRIETPSGGVVELELTGAPVYVSGAGVTGVSAG